MDVRVNVLGGLEVDHRLDGPVQARGKAHKRAYGEQATAASR